MTSRNHGGKKFVNTGHKHRQKKARQVKKLRLSAQSQSENQAKW
jgi:hypothetical protein